MRLPLTAVFLLLYILFSAFTTSADQIKNNDQEAVLMEILMNVTTPFRRKLTTHSGRN